MSFEAAELSSPDGKNMWAGGANASRRNRFGRAMDIFSFYKYCYEHMLITNIKALPMKVKRKVSPGLQIRIAIIGTSCYASFAMECIEFMKGKEFLCGHRFSCD
jgi:hypothetical protein